jgi:hypothetical protein
MSVIKDELSRTRSLVYHQTGIQIIRSLKDYFAAFFSADTRITDPFMKLFTFLINRTAQKFFLPMLIHQSLEMLQQPIKIKVRGVCSWETRAA